MSPAASTPSVATDLEFALRLADIADAISLPRFGALDLVVETKPDLTPVSDADRAVEQALRDAIARDQPADFVLGEEFGDTSTSVGGRRWVIDPIDATKNFVRGVPVWATLIALMDGDDVVVGVASAPALGHRWWAGRGLGSWVRRAGGEPRRNAVSRVAQLSDASVSYSDLPEWDDRRAEFADFIGAAWRARAYGDFWSHTLVAEGAVDISAEPEVSLWDVAALVVIVEEAGGTITGVDGSPAPRAGSIVCTNGLLHDTALRRLTASPTR